MNKTVKGSSMSATRMVAEHLKASKKVMKKVLKSRASARAFLVKAGILEKSGKRLTRPYRAD